MTETPVGGAGSAAPATDDFSPATRTGHAQKITRPSLSYWQDAWIRLRKNGQAVASLGIIIALLLFTLVGPMVWTVDPSEQNLNRISEGPSLSRVNAVVVPELEEWEGIVIPEEEATAGESEPAAVESEQPTETTGGDAEYAESASADDAAAVSVDLDAPPALAIVGSASTQAVRLSWARVPGATGYAVFRSDFAPTSAEDLGIPIGESDAGNRVSYEDRFDLKPTVYFYSVVAKKDGVNAQKFSTLRVELPVSISLDAAQAIRPGVQAGETVELPRHPLGLDYLGRDLLARLMAGARVSLFIGIAAPMFAVLLGIMIGGISGYFGGRIDHWLMRFTDFVLALPFLLFMILFKVVFGGGPGESGIVPMLVAMVVLSWTGPARLVRGQILQLRESEFVQASRLLGARSLYIIFRHLLPNTMGVVLVSLTFAIPTAIFTEAFLSFIGMGVVPPTPSWGSMCNDGIQTFLNHPHEFLFPAFFISLAVLAFNLLGDGLRDALDPRMRGLS